MIGSRKMSTMMATLAAMGGGIPNFRVSQGSRCAPPPQHIQDQLQAAAVAKRERKAARRLKERQAEALIELSRLGQELQPY